MQFLPRTKNSWVSLHNGFMKDMTNALSDRYIKPTPIGYYDTFKIEDFDWEVIPPKQENSDV